MMEVGRMIERGAWGLCIKARAWAGMGWVEKKQRKKEGPLTWWGRADE